MNLRSELASFGEAILFALATAAIAIAVLQDVASKVVPLPASTGPASTKPASASGLRDSALPVSGETR